MTREDRRWANRYWGDTALPKSKAEFFNAVTSPPVSGEGKVATIRLYGPIDSWGGFWGVSAKDVGSVLDELGEDITQIILRINSPGGEVFEGLAILNLFRAHKANVVAVVDGLAGSAASFIAAGADETVMSPGTQMAIHSPIGFTFGNAVDHRKTAEILDSLQAGIVEIYQAKAGDKDWETLLAEETWMSATETVAFGLADRVAVIPDAGEVSTVSDDELIVVIDDAEDSVRVTKLAAGMRPAALLPPSSTEPVEPNEKGDVVAYDDLKAGLIERLGISGADATDDELLAAVDGVLDQATAPAPEPVAATAPEGTTLIASDALAALQADAQAGREAREEQNRVRREGIVDRAMSEGRITAASRDQWLTSLKDNEASATALIESFPKNTIPVDELGHSGGPEESSDEALYNRIYKKEA